MAEWGGGCEYYITSIKLLLLFLGRVLLQDVEENDDSTADYECTGDSPDNHRVFPSFGLQSASEKP